MIEYFIKLLDLDVDEELNLRHKLMPFVRFFSGMKEVFGLVLISSATIGLLALLFHSGAEDQKQRKVERAERAERAEQRKVQKCEAWGKLQKLNATYRIGLGGKCLGRHKNGSLFLINTGNGSLTRLKGRD